MDDAGQMMQAAWDKYLASNLLSDTDEDAEESFKEAFVLASHVILSSES